MVGPSAPPIIPIDAASGSPKSKIPTEANKRDPIIATNTPTWAPAPSIKVLGFDIAGLKSGNAPKPKKTNKGNKSVSKPYFWKKSSIPGDSPWEPSFISSPKGKLANKIPNEIGIKSKGSFFLAIPTYNNIKAINHIMIILGSIHNASIPSNKLSQKNKIPSFNPI